MKKHYVLVALCGLFIILSGCASTMKVSVERIDTGGGNDIGDVEVGQPPLVMAVQSTANSLNDYAEKVDTLRSESVAISELLSLSLGRVADSISECRGKYQEGVELVRKAPYASSVEERYSLAVEMKIYINNVSKYANDLKEFTESQSMSLSDDGIKKTKEFSRFIDSIETLKSNSQAAQAESNQHLGFGGLHNYGVYVLSPGDPRYRDVLKGKSGGVISEARTSTLGNSTIVFFQENPTEIKNFSTDLNAEQLMKNVVLITDKAITAFTKYLSAGAGIPAS